MEMAFLYGEFEDEIYMETQWDMQNVTMKLNKTRYLFSTKVSTV